MTLRTRRSIGARGLVALALVASLADAGQAQDPAVFPTPEEAVRALTIAANASDVAGLLAIFGREGEELFSSSEAAIARQHREVFVVAMAEGWRLADLGPDRRELVVGRERWPFPVPIVRTARGWMFDTAAGKDEVLARRIGRNELAAIRICRTYVTAQQIYAKRAHDGNPAGTYARRVRSDPGTENGLYWPDAAGRSPSPLGPLVAEAAAEGRDLAAPTPPAPFHGYYFRVLEGQGAAAPGGARSYLVDGGMTGGFALIAWPAQYDSTGVMTFVVNQDGVVHEKDLGPTTATVAAAIAAYDPDASWAPVADTGVPDAAP